MRRRCDQSQEDVPGRSPVLQGKGGGHTPCGNLQRLFAIAVCPTEGVDSPTVVASQAANELLNIDSVKATFVLTDYQNKIFISARAIDEVNVQLIMEKMGGGGHINMAGAQLPGATIDEAIGQLKETIDQMIKEGDIEI